DVHHRPAGRIPGAKLTARALDSGLGLWPRPFIFVATMSSPTANPATRLLEKDVPFSQSLLWRRQRELYVERGRKAWSEDRIPNSITNNPFFAEIYARIVTAFVADCHVYDRPLHILEIGGGIGKFAFLFLRHLEELLAASHVALEKIRYTLADCSPALVE